MGWGGGGGFEREETREGVNNTTTYFYSFMQNTDVEKIEEASKESENDVSGALDNSHLSHTSEEISDGEENEAQD